MIAASAIGSSTVAKKEVSSMAWVYPLMVGRK